MNDQNDDREIQLDRRLQVDGATWREESSVGRRLESMIPTAARESADSRGSASRWANRAPLLIAAAVVLLAAAIAIPVWVNRSRVATPPSGPVAAPVCPTQDGGPLVDQGSIRPAEGSLVAEQVPTSMLICEYPGPVIPTGGASTSVGATLDINYLGLRQQKMITTDLSTVPDDLSRFALTGRAACAYLSVSYGEIPPSSSGSDYRVALVYPSGVLWLSDSSSQNNCRVASGMGAVSTGSYADLFSDALQSGIWKAGTRHSVECPGFVDASPYDGEGAINRPGIDTGGKLVPAELPAAVTLCRYLPARKLADVPEFDGPVGFISGRFELTGNYSALVDELRALPDGDPTLWECPVQLGTPSPQLVGLTYGSGPSRTTIWIDARTNASCGAVTNGALTVSGGSFTESVTHALDGHSWSGTSIVDLSRAGAPILGTSSPAGVTRSPTTRSTSPYDTPAPGAPSVTYTTPTGAPSTG